MQDELVQERLLNYSKSERKLRRMSLDFKRLQRFGSQLSLKQDHLSQT